MQRADVVIIGAGVVGLATAHAILEARPGLKVVLLEKEDRIAAHQSGRNSGVIHSGVYYRPESIKARAVASGRRALIEFCRANDVHYDVIGKVIVAGDANELGRLQELDRRARAAGVPAEIVSASRLRELEPHAVGVAALHVPDAGIVDYAEVCRALARLINDADGEVHRRAMVIGLEEQQGAVTVRTEQTEIEALVGVNCAGLHSDLLAPRRHPGAPDIRIVPFRGEYRRLVDSSVHLVRTMIYPVPDPRFPFLGAHFTRAIGGEVHAGPNAVLALAREGYSWRAVDVADFWDLLKFDGFRRLARKHWRTGLGEIHRSLSERAFVKTLQRLIPEIGPSDLIAAPSGVRAQAVNSKGELVDDFVLHETARMIHVLNAPSPAATASLEIGRMVANRTLRRL